MSHLCHFVELWEKIWWKSWYHMASRDLSEDSGHIKFELSSLGMTITHCPTRVSLPKLVILSKPTLQTISRISVLKFKIPVFLLFHTLRKSVSDLCHFVERWEKIWSKSWYHIASRDLSGFRAYKIWVIIIRNEDHTLSNSCVARKNELSYRNPLYLQLFRPE